MFDFNREDHQFRQKLRGQASALRPGQFLAPETALPGNLPHRTVERWPVSWDDGSLPFS